MALVGGGNGTARLGTFPHAPRASPITPHRVRSLRVPDPFLTSRIRGGRGSVPSRQPGQLGAGVGAAFGGLREKRVGAGEVAQVEHGAVAAGRPGPRWTGARAAGRESGRPSSRFPELGWGTRVVGVAAPWLAGTCFGRRLLASPKCNRAPPTYSPPHLYSCGGAGSGLPTPRATAISGGPGPGAVT